MSVEPGDVGEKTAGVQVRKEGHAVLRDVEVVPVLRLQMEVFDAEYLFTDRVHANTIPYLAGKVNFGSFSP
jgi:hypothetical protein